MKLIISKVAGTHEAGFRITEPLFELAYKHKFKSNDSRRTDQINLVLRNKKSLKIFSTLNERSFGVYVTNNKDEEVMYLSCGLDDHFTEQPIILVAPFEDGLRYLFELKSEP